MPRIPHVSLQLRSASPTIETREPYIAPPGAGLEIDFGAHEVRLQGFVLRPFWPPPAMPPEHEGHCVTCNVLVTRENDNSPWYDQYGMDECRAGDRGPHEVEHVRPYTPDPREPVVPDPEAMERVIAAAHKAVSWEISQYAGPVDVHVAVATAVQHLVEQRILEIPDHLGAVFAWGTADHREPPPAEEA